MKTALTKDLTEVIRSTENNLRRFVNERDELRNTVRFCAKHKFEEEQRIAQIKINSVDSIIYEFQEFIKSIRIVIKSHKQSETE